MVLAILPKHGAIGIDDHRGVVIDARLLLLEDRQHSDHRQLGGKCCKALHDRPVGGFGEVVILHVLGDAQIRRVEQLLKADHLRSISLGFAGELLVLPSSDSLPPVQVVWVIAARTAVMLLPPLECHAF
jgi:hypothetical protein